VISVLLANVLQGTQSIAFSLAAARFIDRASGGMFSAEAAISFAILIGVFIFWKISISLTQLPIQKGSLKVRADIRMELTRHVSKIKYEHYENAATRDLMDRAAGNADMNIWLAFLTIISAFQIIVSLASVFMAVAAGNIWAGTTVLLFSAPTLFVSYKNGKKSHKTDSELTSAKREADYIARLFTSREAADERYLFKYADPLLERWERLSLSVWRRQIKQSAKNALGSRAGALITIAGSFAIMASLLPYARGGDISFGLYIALIVSIMDLTEQMTWRLSACVERFVRLNGYFADLGDLFRLEVVPETQNRAPDSRREFSSLEFKGVSFSYPGTDRAVLKNVTFKLRGGDTLGIVGRNGSGKTTIIKLLTKLYDSYTGEILINGTELRSMSHEDMRSVLCVIYQDFAKYDISIHDNMMLGDIGNIGAPRTKTGGTIGRVIDSLALGDLIDKLPEGLDTPLGKLSEASQGVSGGQWQKIAIARALLSRSPLLIFDEPTSALDPMIESEIHRRMAAMTRERPMVTISHRLPAVISAGNIIVLEAGEIVEQGTHENLLGVGGLYSKMFDEQRSWYR
jgi:ATP-binding cassette subfamily B protein